MSNDPLEGFLVEDVEAPDKVLTSFEIPEPIESGSYQTKGGTAQYFVYEVSGGRATVIQTPLYKEGLLFYE